MNQWGWNRSNKPHERLQVVTVIYHVFAYLKTHLKVIGFYTHFSLSVLQPRLTFMYRGLIPSAYMPLSILTATIIGPDAPNKQHLVYSTSAATGSYNEYPRLRSDVSWSRHHSLPPPTKESGLSPEHEASKWHTFLTLINTSSVTYPTILLVDQ